MYVGGLCSRTSWCEVWFGGMMLTRTSGNCFVGLFVDGVGLVDIRPRLRRD